MTTDAKHVLALAGNASGKHVCGTTHRDPGAPLRKTRTLATSHSPLATAPRLFYPQHPWKQKMSQVVENKDPRPVLTATLLPVLWRSFLPGPRLAATRLNCYNTHER